MNDAGEEPMTVLRQERTIILYPLNIREKIYISSTRHEKYVADVK